MKLLIPCLLAAGLACGQNTLEIRGAVVEGALGIAGATVTLYEFGHEPASATTRTVFATTSTDSKGEFVFHPARAGEYYVEVKKEGYFAESFDGPTVDPVETTGDPVSLDRDHALQERRFTLMRLGELRGRVIDEDGKPLANLSVGIRPGSFTPVITDQDGYFTATKLRPGGYLVSVLRRGPEILPQFSADDLKIVDQDLEVLNWPGIPVPVSSGASLSVGTITARKTPYYRAHLSVQADDCIPGEKWTFSAAAEMAGFGPQVPCGKQFLVRNLSRGAYTFVLSTNRGETPRRAMAAVEVTDRNLEVAMSMSAGTEISGRLVAIDGVTLPPLGKIMIEVSPVAGPIGRQTIAPDPTGRFLIRALPSTGHRISVDGMGSKFYVKEIHYNGLTLTDGVITPAPGVPGQLEIVIEDQAATITGLVAERSTVPGRVMVVVIKTPLATTASTPVDDQGRFKMGGLAPGEYHLLALTEDMFFKNGAGFVELSGRAETVTVERGGSKSVTLKIVEP